MKPSMQRQMLMRESAEQMPHLTHWKESESVYTRLKEETRPKRLPGCKPESRILELEAPRAGQEVIQDLLTTAIGGKMIARRPRKISEEHIFVVCRS